jgi:hypothetical protein
MKKERAIVYSVIFCITFSFKNVIRFFYQRLQEFEERKGGTLTTKLTNA